MPLDRDEFANLFRDAIPRLICVAVGIVGNRHLAEDIVQDAGMVAFEKRADFAVGTNFGAWVATIVRHTALRKREYEGRRAMTAIDSVAPSMDKAEPEGVEGTASLVEARTWTADSLGLSDTWAAALAGLSEEYRVSFMLREIGMFSYREIAETLDVPEGTVMSRVHRARQALFEQLAERMDMPRRVIGES